jgi:hypothetical protein
MEYEHLGASSFIWNMEILISILLLHQSYCCFIRELVNPAVYAVEQNRKAKLSDKTVLFVPKKKWLL